MNLAGEHEVHRATSPIAVDGQSLSLAGVVAVARHGRAARIHSAAYPRMAASRAVVEEIVSAGRPAYGITTGFGSLSDRTIPAERVKLLQANLLRSHACGAGDPFPSEVVRAAMLLRANALAAGFSGVRPLVVETLLALLNAGIHPIVPCQGSLGASGDLAPLAHLALPLIGLGRVEIDGSDVEALPALRAHAISPVTLEPKEALALINGTQVMTALGVLALHDAEQLLDAATSVAALSLVATGARRAPLDPRVHAVRPHPGQVRIANRLRTLLESEPEPAPASGRIQDPYSLRCIPQVYGAIFGALETFRATLEIEVNAATDNPLVFAGGGDVVSGGNFHGHPLALGADATKTAIASLGTIIERRIYVLVNSEDRGLPSCLAPEPGINSGYMIAHYLTAGLVAENRVLAHPSSVDSLPTSAGVEDYNSMGATAARHLRAVIANVETIVAVEALCAAQACDLRGTVPTGPLGRLYRTIRERVPTLHHDDRVIHDDIVAATGILRQGRLAVPDLDVAEDRVTEE